ncbi:fungal-specific transcription factor domain-containing protein [Emericellopsis atlantica]|uniref:Fungal-specific transcription factor domain-containing protein n=1 Tax=Emericellopsis atlantica TaxID=2614577 RepID=A0A9P8CQA9_9HYPO|nr:fungal-specific transcription factor domain-containing protein [Emericellopsis atlantica]KAG9253561.1 fungal-specific transcription factor domain-containing protein [Emericellopsis atlantica]
MRQQRTRSGCLTCRARRKKCDEVKPRCAGCRRNQIPCNWPPPPPPLSTQPSTTVAQRTASLRRKVDDIPPARPAVSIRPTDSLSVLWYQHQQHVSVIPPPVPMVHRGADSDGGGQRPCALTPLSVSIFSHFLTHTASFFAMGPLQDNPFVTLLVPLASTDDLLMHALLALSGAHMASQDPRSQGVARATALHYARLISGLRAEFGRLQEGDLAKKERLLCLLLVACHYESLVASRSMNTENGLLYHASPFNNGLLGFSLELYTYTMLCNLGMHPPSTGSVADLLVMPFEDMSKFPTFGALFAGSHDLYRLIPEIDALAWRRRVEERNGLARPSIPLVQDHDSLHSRLSAWAMAPPAWPGERDRDLKCASAEALRHALHIYLATALAGSVVTGATWCAVRRRAGALFPYIRTLVASQHYVATLVWPVMIGASCIVEPEPQAFLMQQIRSNWSGMGHVGMMADVLQLLWDDPDPEAFGPRGLNMIMEKNNKTICIL